MRLARILLCAVMVLTSAIPLAFHPVMAQAIDNSRFQTKMHDATGQIYDIYLFANDETSSIVRHSWAGAVEGDIIYAGHYQFAVALSGRQTAKTYQITPTDADPLSFNDSRRAACVMASLSPGQPDILFMLQAGDSNNILSSTGLYIRHSK